MGPRRMVESGSLLLFFFKKFSRSALFCVCIGGSLNVNVNSFIFTSNAVCVKCNLSKSGLKSAACQIKGVINRNSSSKSQCDTHKQLNNAHTPIRHRQHHSIKKNSIKINCIFCRINFSKISLFCLF